MRFWDSWFCKLVTGRPHFIVWNLKPVSGGARQPFRSSRYDPELDRTEVVDADGFKWSWSGDEPPREVLATPQLVRRWLIPRNKYLNIYLHHVLESDDDRALHDHPWWSVSVLLRGHLAEWRTDTPQFGETGTTFRIVPWLRPVVRRPEEAHRLLVVKNKRRPWTLFITGPRIRVWGFWCQDSKGRPKHVDWREFTKENKSGLPTGCPQED